MKYDYFSFTKNELILYVYLSNKGSGNYELLTADFLSLGMSKTGFYNGRDGLIKRGYLTKIRENYYHFESIKS